MTNAEKKLNTLKKGKNKMVSEGNRTSEVENKPLARMIYHNVDIGAEIPPELYQAVAEVLATVYRMKNM